VTRNFAIPPGRIDPVQRAELQSAGELAAKGITMSIFNQVTAIAAGITAGMNAKHLDAIDMPRIEQCCVMLRGLMSAKRSSRK